MKIYFLKKGRQQDLIRPHFLKRNSSQAVRTHKAHHGSKEQKWEDEEEAHNTRGCANASLQRVKESGGNNRQERKDAGLAISADHRPPTSPARTTNLTRPPSPASSGHVGSFRLLAATSAAPGLLLCLPWQSPSPRSVLTNVASIESWAPLSTPGTCDKSRSRTITLVATLAPPSRQMRATATSTAKPRRPPETAHADR